MNPLLFDWTNKRDIDISGVILRFCILIDNLILIKLFPKDKGSFFALNYKLKDS